MTDNQLILLRRFLYRIHGKSGIPNPFKKATITLLERAQEVHVSDATNGKVVLHLVPRIKSQKIGDKSISIDVMIDKDEISELPNIVGKIMYKVEIIRNTCVAAPSQWEGTLSDGRWIYIRFRHGHLSVRIGDTQDTSILGKEIFSKECGDSYAGRMNYEELKIHLKNQIELPSSEG